MSDQAAEQEIRGRAVGQQAGTAIGLAAFSVLAVASADGSALAARLHGLQVATLGTSALALAAAVLAGLTLPRGIAAAAPGSPAGEYQPGSGQSVLPVQAED